MLRSDIVTTKQPMIDTSSMASLRILRDTRSSMALRSPRPGPSNGTASNTAMSTIGNKTANPAYNTNAMKQFTSPWATQWKSSPRHAHTLTFICKSAGKSNGSRRLLIARRSGRTSYNNDMSKCKDMLGLARPKESKITNEEANTTWQTVAARRGSMCLGAISAMLASGSGAFGTRTPRDETVEPTQKTQKHVKPRPKFMKLLMVVGLFKPRIKYINKM
mmetsp:Transcript_39271/g.118708  ORF Transcript_39271/g.118708 Transcript_39271/m.118708 type:complete len:219 (+) Transcript_39271:751-1407(+)